MELIYFFIGLWIAGTVGFIYVRWFYKEDEGGQSKDTAN